MNGVPIKFYYIDADDMIALREFDEAQVHQAVEFAAERKGMLLVDVEDFTRLVASMVVAERKEGLIHSALFVMKQLNLEKAVELAPLVISVGGMGSNRVEDIASTNISEASDIGMFSKEPKEVQAPEFGKKPTTGKKKKKV